MIKVFLTGATGLLGTNVINKLLKDDYFVIALVRKKSNYKGEKSTNLKLVEGGLFTDVSMHLKGVDYFIHIAAETGQHLLSYEDYRKINCDAAIHLFSQSVACELKKFLFVSTANTLGYGDLENPGNEFRSQRFPFTKSFYAKSKSEAENYLMQNNSETEVVILNPTFMLGAYDHKPSSGKIIFWGWRKKMVFCPKGGKNFVHVEDAADGILNAIKKGKNREKYILANENLKYKDFFQKLNLITNQNPIMIPIPDLFLTVSGFIGDLLRFFKIETNLSSVNIKALQIDNFYSNKKSIEELGMNYLPTEKAISDAVVFFKK